MRLYSYCQSSGAYRVRIALALKGIAVEMYYINLTKGEQQSAAYAAVNPQQLVPALVTDGGQVITQSLAIMEYLDEMYPTVPLLPVAPLERARVRAIAQAMAMDIAPLNNLKIRKAVKAKGWDEREWIAHWTHEGLAPVEKMLAESGDTGTYCHGSRPSLADCVLVPQLFHARRFGCDLAPYPTLLRIDAACAKLSAFVAAHPMQQADFS